MKIRTFIDRPILAGVISVVFLIIGLIGLSQLPVEQLLVEEEVMYIIFSTPLSASSNGTTTLFCTVSALAPV